MHSVFHFIGSLFPKAYAVTVDTIGRGAPGIDEMWANIRKVFPHTDLGKDGLAFIFLSIIHFILNTIGAVAVLAIIYAGIKMITGGEEGLGEAKKILMYSAGGLIAAICSNAVIAYACVLIQQAAGGGSAACPSFL